MAAMTDEELRSLFSGLRQEMRQEMAEMRHEMAGVRDEMAGVRAENVAMHGETRRYVDERLTASAEGTRSHVDERLTASAEGTRRYVDERLTASAEGTRRYVDERLTASAEGMRAENVAMHEETRRHVDITAEDLRHRFDLLAEAVAYNHEELRHTRSSLEQKIESTAADTVNLFTSMFNTLERRVSNLEAGR
jgi:hypothetical protein